jgi:hypothetical protein
MQTVSMPSEDRLCVMHNLETDDGDNAGSVAKKRLVRHSNQLTWVEAQSAPVSPAV